VAALSCDFRRSHAPTVFHFPLSDFSSSLASVQPDKLETLDDLLVQAEHYAGFCMVQQRKDVAHAFSDWRSRAAHVRAGFVG
jgi:hypothetical protein